jgi:drug/metabolite transporter (DMT)-like permease
VPVRTLIGLILCNFLWSAHPLMGKYLLESFSPPQAAWLRYAAGLASFLAVGAALRLRRRALPLLFAPRTLRDGGVLFCLGFFAFCFSPLLQLSGLSGSRAADNALIVAMEPLMAVFLAWLLLRERPAAGHWAAFGVALIGFFLLAGSRDKATPDSGWDPRLMANLLILASLLGKTLYSSLGRKLIDRHPPVAVFGSALLLGVACLSLATARLSGLPSWDQLTQLSFKAFLALIWLGPFGTTLSYLYWMTALKKAPVASIALTLFIQPVFGPFWGMAFLDERLSGVQWVGSGLILGAILGQTILQVRRSGVGKVQSYPNHKG